MDFVTILLSALILAGLALAVTFAGRANRRSGGCGGGCTGCERKCEWRDGEQEGE